MNTQTNPILRRVGVTLSRATQENQYFYGTKEEILSKNKIARNTMT